MKDMRNCLFLEMLPRLTFHISLLVVRPSCMCSMGNRLVE